MRRSKSLRHSRDAKVIFAYIFFRKLILFTGEKIESTTTNDVDHGKYDVFFMIPTHKLKKIYIYATSKSETVIP